MILKNQWLEADQVRHMQEIKLRNIINYAYENVPFYREMFDSHKIKPTDINSIDDLKRLPIISKKHVKDNFPEKMLSKEKDNIDYEVRDTSGSSGNKLTHAIDAESLALFRLMQYRQIKDCGYKITDKIVYIRYGDSTRFFLQKFGLLRREFIDLNLSPEEQLAELLRIKPQIVNAYGSVLYSLAKIVTEDEVKQLNFKFLWSNSEALIKENKKFVESKFNCKVYDDYSCLEFLGIGFECRLQGYHVVSDNVIIEVVDDNDNPVKQGDTGRFIITALNNKIMPYIRYDIGDIGSISPEPCKCGRGFPIFKNFIGRINDFIVLPNGNLLEPMQIFVKLWKVIPEAIDFQVIQKDINELTIKVIPVKKNIEDYIKMKIKDTLAKAIPDNMDLNIKIVNDIPRTATGKHKAIISEIKGVDFNKMNKITI